jgi:cold-inducible RNA-binding protein
VTKLYVGNLPYSTTDEQLGQLFADYPVASATVIMDRRSGRSKGFGFVEIEDDAQAQAATEALNGSDFDGRAVVVNVARPREER